MINHNLQGIGDEEAVHVLNTINRHWVTSGSHYTDKIEELVGEICNKKNPPNCVATMNGTAALHTVFEVLAKKFSQPDRNTVLVPAVGWYSTAMMPLLAGFNVQIMDVNPSTGMLTDNSGCPYDQQTLQARWDDVFAVTPVHLNGHFCVLLSDFLPENAFVVEDAAGALGTYTPRNLGLPITAAGNTSGIGIYSFNGNKIVTGGQGGMIVTQFEEVADEARNFINHAKTEPLAFGTNYRLPEINAALIYGQLNRFVQLVEARRGNWDLYKHEINSRGLPLEIVTPRSGNCWSITFKTGGFAVDLERYLRDNEIEARLPVNIARKFPADTSTPGADEFCRNHISLPSGSNLTMAEIHRVGQVVERFCNDHPA